MAVPASSRLRLRRDGNGGGGGGGGMRGTIQVDGDVARPPVPPQQQQQPPQQMTARRQVFADVARRRASHFANFNEDDDDDDEDEEEDEEEEDDDDDDDDDDDAIHTGGDQARGLGMWSTARQLARGKSQKQKRKHAETAASLAKKLEEEEAAIGWRPMRKLHPPRPLRLPGSGVEPLVSQILEWVADRAEEVETLAGLPDVIRMRLSRALTSRRRINADTVHLLTSGAAAEVEIGNCAELDEEQLSTALELCDLERIEALRLSYCGRGLTHQSIERLLLRSDDAGNANAASGNARSKFTDSKTYCTLPLLREALLRGAYRLSDKGLHLLLSATPNLESLSLMACTRLSPSGIVNIASKVQMLKSLDLYQCQQLDCTNIVATVAELPYLERLCIADLPQMTDEAVGDMVSNVGTRLLELNIGYCSKLTRISIAAIGACCPNLETLKMERLPLLNKLTASAAAEKDSAKKMKKRKTNMSGAENPDNNNDGDHQNNVDSNVLEPLVVGCTRLRHLYLEELDVSDGDLALLLSNGSVFSFLSLRRMPGAANETSLSIANRLADSLQELDVSFSRNINSCALGLIVDSCKKLLTLSVWGCTQLTRTFYDGHSNDDVNVVGAHDIPA